MPVPASDAIASDVGHGALGIRYGLRPFRDLLSETVGQRHLWVEMRPKKLVTAWATEGGGVWSWAVSETFDGVVLDVVGVRTLTETLARVEAQALATAGKFYYSGTTLYIHLMGDAVPSATSVVVEFGVHIGTHGVVQPVLGVDRLANGSFEAWTGAAPDGWTVTSGVSAGTITVDKTTSDPLEGSYAARVTFAAATGAMRIRQDFTTLVAGQVYRFSGAYRITGAAGILAAIYIDDAGTNFVLPDGRTIGASTQVFTDTSNDGAWRRFAFDFLCPAWGTLRASLFAQVVTGTLTGTVDFDDVRLSPIYRFAYYEPLLNVDSIPTVEAARADSFWGEMSSALGSLSLLNGGGRLEPLLAAYDWLGADAIIRVGGRYQLGGNETLMDDCPVIASGKLGAPTVTDSAVSFDLEDDRKLLLRTLPTRTYNDNSGTGAYQPADRGRSRALLWGTKTGIRPVQYDIHTTGGGPVSLGSYEVADCTDWPAIGLAWMDYVYWYTDEDAALVRSAARRVAVGSTGASSIVESLPTGRFDVLHDMRPIILTDENNKLHFDIGGAVLVAAPSTTWPPYPLSGLPTYDPTSLCSEITYWMNTIAGTSDIRCIFKDVTQKVQIERDSGTLNLRCATGADVQMGIWAILGFNVTADRTGSLGYLADRVFTSPAGDQILRIDARGYGDDGAGTYTGTASAVIEKAPDIGRFILREILKVPASAINLPSFVAARTGAKPCSLYIGSPRTVSDVFSELETSGNFDFVLNGGVWYCLPRDTSTPAGTPALVDADFLSFGSHYDPEDLYGTVRLTYNDAPDSDELTEMGEVSAAAVALRHGRPDQRAFATCLRDKADATYPLSGSRLEAIAAQAQVKRRRFRFSTKGKALQVPVGGKILLTRSRGLDTTGALSSLLVRVISKRDDWTRWVSDVEAIEVV